LCDPWVFPPIASSEVAKRLEREYAENEEKGKQGTIDTSDEEDEMSVAMLRQVQAEDNQPIAVLPTVSSEAKAKIVQEENERAVEGAKEWGKRRDQEDSGPGAQSESE
jgi:hypothetical protein